MSDTRLAGRAAVITGASDGIGLGIAQRYAQAGGAVLLSDVDDAKGEAATKALKDAGAKVAYQHCDVTKKDDVLALVARCVKEFGAVDILVNNAYRGEGIRRIEQWSDDSLQTNLLMNLYGPKWAMEAALPHMKAKKWGRIVNICSLNGVNAHMGSMPYNSSKEALRSYTRTAAREWAPYGIAANIICPAAASASYKKFKELQPATAEATAAANPMGRMGDPAEDIGGVAVFLASEDARYLTGNTLFVDGGGHINGVPWVPELGD